MCDHAALSSCFLITVLSFLYIALHAPIILSFQASSLNPHPSLYGLPVTRFGYFLVISSPIVPTAASYIPVIRLVALSSRLMLPFLSNTLYLCIASIHLNLIEYSVLSSSVTSLSTLTLRLVSLCGVHIGVVPSASPAQSIGRSAVTGRWSPCSVIMFVSPAIVNSKCFLIPILVPGWLVSSFEVQIWSTLLAASVSVFSPWGLLVYALLLGCLVLKVSCRGMLVSSHVIVPASGSVCPSCFHSGLSVSSVVHFAALKSPAITVDDSLCSFLHFTMLSLTVFHSAFDSDRCVLLAYPYTANIAILFRTLVSFCVPASLNIIFTALAGL